MIDLKTDIMATMTETERKNIFDWCIANLQKIIEKDNWIIFKDNNNWCYSIAKPKTGCGNSFFGSYEYVKKLYSL